MVATQKFSQILPAPSNPALTDSLLGVGGGVNDFLYSLLQVASTVIAPPQNIVSAGGTFVLSPNNYGDVIVTTTTALTVQFPSASSRNGFPASIVGASGAPSITGLPAAGETFFGLGSFTITNPWGAITLWPLPGIGWYRK